MADPKTEVEAVKQLTIEGATQPRALTLTGPAGPFSVLARPAGNGAWVIDSTKKLEDERLERPERREGTTTLHSIASFLAMFDRWADPGSIIFADQGGPRLTGIIDYHPEGYEAEPRFGRHRLVYEFPHAEEWTRWRAFDGQWQKQEEFAQRIEDVVVDIDTGEHLLTMAREFSDRFGGVKFAGPSALLELSRGLAVRVGAAVKNAVKLQSGEAQVNFVVEHTDIDGKPLQVPAAFLINIPVFRDGATYQLPVRLRYRVTGGTILWATDLYRPDRVLKHAFEAVVDEAAALEYAEPGKPPTVTRTVVLGEVDEYEVDE